MRNETTNTAVPKLRFPEFREAGEWEIKKLGKLAAIAKGVQVNKIELSADMKYPVMNGGINPSGYLNTFNRLASTICISEGGNSCGFVNLMQTPFWSGGHNYTLDKLNGISTDFLYQFLKFREKEIMALRVGSGLPNIQIGALRSFDAFHPSPVEQQKIAATLSSLDDLLTAQSAKLAALQAHKRGLMQGLFPAEGETVPKLRFPAFRDEWQKNSLANLTDLLSGYAFQSAFFSASGKRLLTPKNFTRTGYASFNNGNTKYTTEPFDSKYICKEGDLLLLLTDLTPSCELLGKPVLLTKNDGEVLLNQRIVKIIPKSDVEIDFLFHFFSTDAYHKRIRETASGSTVRHSSNKIIASTELYLPSKEEQRKIADIFSSLNDRITAQSQQIEALKLHKKGLMQGLFPAAAEPTA